MAYIVAIDGPAGAGKSTIAKGVADKLGVARVDTGAIYRTLTLITLERSLPDDEVPDLLHALDLRFESSRVFIGDREITQEIRTARVTEHVSRIAAMPAVRRELLSLQRGLGRAHPVGAVMEGRDIGTVVFPDAEVKVFLTASAEERARRRVKDLEAAKEPADQLEVLAAIEERDRIDSERAVSPLKPAEDAVRLDSTGKTIDQVIQEIVALVKAKGLTH